MDSCFSASAPIVRQELCRDRHASLRRYGKCSLSASVLVPSPGSTLLLGKLAELTATPSLAAPRGSRLLAAPPCSRRPALRKRCPSTSAVFDEKDAIDLLLHEADLPSIAPESWIDDPASPAFGRLNSSALRTKKSLAGWVGASCAGEVGIGKALEATQMHKHLTVPASDQSLPASHLTPSVPTRIRFAPQTSVGAHSSPDDDARSVLEDALLLTSISE